MPPKKGPAIKKASAPRRARPVRVFNSVYDSVDDEGEFQAARSMAESWRFMLSIDLGPRNMGVSVFDRAKNRFVRITHNDLFEEPDKRSYTVNELAPRMSEFIAQNKEFLECCVWVVELQLVGSTDEEIHRLDNVVLQSVLQTAAFIYKKPLILASPRSIKRFYGFEAGGHDSNKAEAIVRCGKILNPEERALMRASTERRLQLGRAHSPKPYNPKTDDMADSVLNALYAAEKLTGEKFYTERLERLNPKINGN